MPIVSFVRSAMILATVISLLFCSACNADTKAETSSPVSESVNTVLITGANRGLGLEFARQYAADGWRVIGTARNPSAADELGDLDVDIVQLDVTDPASISRLAADLQGQPIDMLINNAGIMTEIAWKLPQTDFEDVEKTLAVNLLGPMRVTHALLQNLQQGKLKKIINITSSLGSIAGNDSGGFYGYRESKAALNMFTRSLSVELADDGFICISIRPGWVATDMGGDSAPIKPPESISGMRSVIDNLTRAENGSFWTHEGEQMPW